MATAFVSAVGYLITSHAVGQPSPHLTWPIWPYYLCGAMFAVGALVYGGVRGMLPWQKYRALKRRAEAAESERDEARRKMGEAARTPAPGLPPASAPGPLPLAPRYDQTAAYRHPKDWTIEHRVGVLNPPGQPERRARMYLVDMEPLPRNIGEPRWAPDIPYTVPPLSGGNPDAGLIVRPGQEELWNIGTTGTGSDGNMNAGGFTGGIRWACRGASTRMSAGACPTG